MRHRLLILAGCAAVWVIAAAGVILYVDRKLRQAAGWLG